jgi:hypothetical protein
MAILAVLCLVSPSNTQQGTQDYFGAEIVTKLEKLDKSELKDRLVAAGIGRNWFQE